LRIVVDLQGAQSSISRARGVGRYSMGFAQAIARHAGSHEIWIALSGLFPETIEPLRAAFEDLVPQKQLVVWRTVRPVAARESSTEWKREIGERVREAFLADLKPDVIHVSSLFEGFVDNAVTSVGRFDRISRTAVALYDLIPLVHRAQYLNDPSMESWYERKLTDLRCADLWLAISESSRNEGIEHLNLPHERVINISTAADSIFRPLVSSVVEQEELKHRYSLDRSFIMYTGGIDRRKNMENLIGAYACLPDNVRGAHQLAIVCSATDEEMADLKRLARRRGIRRNELVVTGFVPDQDLVALYNLCSVFIFPSWHEGFGLPALEAMSCGAATIGADAPGVREVIGRDDALFNAHNETDMSARLHAVLTDTAFRQDLRQYALQRSRIFSWPNTARSAMKAFEALYDRRRSRTFVGKIPGEERRPRLAYVSPLPPERSGIAEYAAQLLPELARHYEIDAIVDQSAVDEPWIRANISCRTVHWFEQNASTYDRILYNFGNSDFHRHMFAMLERYPGIVVLHDFFLSGVIAHMDRLAYAPDAWTTALYVSHGYPAAKEAAFAQNPSDAVWKYPANLAVLEHAAGVIVHSDFARELARAWYGERCGRDWITIPMVRQATATSTRAECRKQLGWDEQDFIVCCFGMMGPTKLNRRLIDVWADSSLGSDHRCRLLFVGEGDSGEYGVECDRAIARSASADRISRTNFLGPALYRSHLLGADVAVQLRGHSRGETSAAVLECMAYGLPTIVNVLGASAELPADCLVRLPATFSNADLLSALLEVRQDSAKAREIGRRAKAYILAHHNPRTIADQYWQAVEQLFTAASTVRGNQLATTIAELARSATTTDDDWVTLATCIAENEQSNRSGPGQWLVDISELVRRDAKSGIQRVVRAILMNWLAIPPAGFRVEPVYCDSSGAYRYARKFTTEFLGMDTTVLRDELIETRPGDVFVALDLFLHLLPERNVTYGRMRLQGVRIFFIVYDLLLIRRPDLFFEGGDENFRSWLESLARFADGAICISRTVADELTEWLDSTRPSRERSLRIGWFHLAAGGGSPQPTEDHSPAIKFTLDQLTQRPSVLMVGTLEPRKAHAQALAAFEALWDGGTDVTLVVAGKAGWMVESLVKRLNQHPERGQRLLWIESATDDELQSLYEASSGVLMASQGEGFGLPLVEAATHRRPILARDLPVFREVAGEHATYFSGLSAASLAAALASWLIALNNGSVPKSDSVRHLTWDESSRWLTEIILKDRWYRDWTSGSNEESPRQDSTSGKPEPNLETTTRSEPPWGAGVPAADHRG
jgi:glycosyltransferase involved in cell wall biosynthesis